MRDRIGVDFTTNHITMVNLKLIRENHIMHDIGLISLEWSRKYHHLRNKYNPSSVGTGCPTNN